ncbi:MAG: MFS transporter [Nanoarchaeota archaeon]|nr:MFS transporter [Nanoarchaeota archaeon]
MDEKFKRLMLIDAFFNFMYGLVAPFLTIYFNEFGGFEEVGFSIAIMYIVKAFVSFGAGRVLKKYNARLVLLISQLLEGIRVFFFLIATNVFWVYGIQFIGGIINGFITPAYDAIFVKVSKKEQDSSFGEMNGVTTMAVGVSALISGVILDYFGYVPMFILWGVSEIIYGIYIYFKIK